MNDVDPQAWLTDILARLRTTQQNGSTNYCPELEAATPTPSKGSITRLQKGRALTWGAKRMDTKDRQDSVKRDACCDGDNTVVGKSDNSTAQDPLPVPQRRRTACSLHDRISVRVT